jgi:transposase
MLNLAPNTKAFICAEPIDMRSSFDSLSGMIKSNFGQNPLSGKLFVFFSRQRNRMKILLWEVDGFALYYKRLERGTFTWLQDFDLKDSCEISASDFSVLLAGVNYKKSTPQFRAKHKKKGPLQLV